MLYEVITGTDAAGVDADAGPLGDIAHHRRSGGVDGVQAVIAFDQHAGAELAGRRAHPGHDGGGHVITSYSIHYTKLYDFYRLRRDAFAKALAEQFRPQLVFDPRAVEVV